MSVAVKVCGITTIDDALAAVDAGVDLIGFNFWPKSKRFLAPELAASIIRALPSRVMTVGLFVNAAADSVRAAMQVSGAKLAQLHGDETSDVASALGVSVMQVVRVSDPDSATAARAWPFATHVLVDASVVGYGGAGQRFDWALIEVARERLGRNVFVAGGLTPENVGELVRAHRPAGVDVASGVERVPGVKDHERMRAFVQAVREASAR